ncbi:MAG: putative porin, partial [Planctomycetota bacterium]
YGNLQGLEDELGLGFGNTIDPGTGAWVNDYDILELLAEYGTKLGILPVSVFGTWVQNTAAVTDGDTGWLVGATVGKAKDPGSWQFGYDYRDIERDAVLAVWNDSDFNAGRTGGKGHVFRGAYQAFKNVQLALTYFLSEITYTDPDLDYERIQADLKLKF